MGETTPPQQPLNACGEDACRESTDVPAADSGVSCNDIVHRDGWLHAQSRETATKGLARRCRRAYRKTPNMHIFRFRTSPPLRHYTFAGHGSITCTKGLVPLNGRRICSGNSSLDSFRTVTADCLRSCNGVCGALSACIPRFDDMVIPERDFAEAIASVVATQHVLACSLSLAL